MKESEEYKDRETGRGERNRESESESDWEGGRKRRQE